MDELEFSSRDPFLLGAQLRWDARWNEQWQTTLSLAGLSLGNSASLATTNLPDINNGNLRRPDGRPAHHFNPLSVDGAVTTSLPSFPGYRGAFPVSLHGQFLWNPAANRDNTAWAVGPTLGKLGPKGTWENSYRWKHLGGDAWFEEFVDDDFGAFYETASARGRAGFRPGTNGRGHVVRATYAVFDALTLGVLYFHTELIHPAFAGSDSRLNRLFAEATLRF